MNLIRMMNWGKKPNKHTQKKKTPNNTQQTHNSKTIPPQFFLSVPDFGLVIALRC